MAHGMTWERTSPPGQAATLGQHAGPLPPHQQHHQHAHPPPADPMEYARINRNAFDPTLLPETFAMPRFATPGYSLGQGQGWNEWMDQDVIKDWTQKDYLSPYPAPQYTTGLTPPVPVPASGLQLSVAPPTSNRSIGGPFEKGASFISSVDSERQSPPNVLSPLGPTRNILHQEDQPYYGLHTFAPERSYVAPTPDQSPQYAYTPQSVSTHSSSSRSPPDYNQPQEGIDVRNLLNLVAMRANPEIDLGPIDANCAFIVVDAWEKDYPIVFASDTFSRLTGYSTTEVVGHNCRFLQSDKGLRTPGGSIGRNATDRGAVYNMKRHMLIRKECQSSLVNFKKDGTPFLNLVTIVPVPDGRHFIGFQTDVIDQPDAIQNQANNGTYIVNYSALSASLDRRDRQFAPVSQQPQLPSVRQPAYKKPGPSVPGLNLSTSTPWQAIPLVQQPSVKLEYSPTQAPLGLSMPAPLSESPEVEEPVFVPERPSKRVTSMEEHNRIETAVGLNEAQVGEMLDLVTLSGVNALGTAEERKIFNKVLLEQADDLIHILSLKGSFLYCSPSTAKILDYEPSDLIGKTLPAFVHPCDVVPIMRELKEIGNTRPVTEKVHLTYRLKRKGGEYVWMESFGKLHIEAGKGRKSVILTGRPKEMMRMSHAQMEGAQLGENEFWTKLSLQGMVLANTRSVSSVLNLSSADIKGMSIFQLVEPAKLHDFLLAFQACGTGRQAKLSYRMRGRSGDVAVVTRFYPATFEGDGASTSKAKHFSVILQTNTEASEAARLKDGRARPRADRTGASASQPSSSDNLFSMLEASRGTTWQFELHQLQNANKRLREERDALLKSTGRTLDSFGIKRPRVDEGEDEVAEKAPSEVTSKSGRKKGKKHTSPVKSVKEGKGCANCGKKDGNSLHLGPTGPETLCGPCNTRWTARPSGQPPELTGIPIFVD